MVVVVLQLKHLLQLVQVVVYMVEQLMLTPSQMIQQSHQTQELMVMVMMGVLVQVQITMVEVAEAALVVLVRMHQLVQLLLQLAVQDYQRHQFLG